MKQIPHHLSELLDRYWAGETTLEEERMLKSFFADGDIPEAYQREAKWFHGLQEAQRVQLPRASRVVAPTTKRLGWYALAAAAAVLAVLTAGIWWWKAPDAFPAHPIATMPKEKQPAAPLAVAPPVIRQEPVAPPNTNKRVVRTPKNKTPQPQVETKIQPALAADTCDDPEEALAEIKAALALVSSKINKGRHTLDKGLQEVEHVEVLVKRSM